MLTLVMVTGLMGCLSSEALLSGVLTDAMGGGTPVAGAAVVGRDTTGMRYSEASTADDGSFELALPTGQVFYLHAEAEGFAPTSFTGMMGTDPIELGEGVVWLRQEADLEAVRAEFAGCAPESLGPDVGVLEGEVRLYVAPQQAVETLPLVTTATVTVYTNAGVAYGGCYLDDDGESSPEAVITGETGRFAVFGVAEGPVSVLIEYDYGGDAPHEDWYTFFVPAGGVVPLYPALVGMP